MLLLSLWLVVLALEERRSDTIFLNRSSRRDLLFVVTRRGNRVFNSLD